MTGQSGGVNMAACRQGDKMIVMATDAQPEYVASQARSVLAGAMLPQSTVGSY
jgi:hypothetical protein